MAVYNSDFRSQLIQLCDTQYANVLHNSNFVSGVIFAVCSAPEIPMPDTWLVWTFRQHGQLASNTDADKIADVLMSALQEQLREISAETFDFPMKNDVLPNPATKELSVSQWLSGVLFGHSQLESLWRGCWEQIADKQPEKLAELQRNLKHCLMMFSTFANVPLALKQAEKIDNRRLIENIDKIFASLPDALKLYVDLAGELAPYMPDQFESFTQTPDA